MFSKYYGDFKSRVHIICVDVGGYGRNSDGSVLEESIMGKSFEAGTLNVPKSKPLSNQLDESPMVLKS